jgi:hypothetical protein
MVRWWVLVHCGLLAGSFKQHLLFAVMRPVIYGHNQLFSFSETPQEPTQQKL